MIKKMILMIYTSRIPQRGHGISPLSLEVMYNQNVGTFENLETFENLGNFLVLILIHRYNIFKNIGT